MTLTSLLVGAIAFGVSWLVAGRLAAPGSRVRLLDRPNERSLHARPIPRTGGLAVLAGILAGALVLVFAHALDGAVVWLLVMALGLGGVSFIDDWIGLPALVRFAAHFVAALGVVYGLGARIDSLSLPGVGTWGLGVLAAPLTVLGLMWMVNLYNFMDGMDGFAGGMTVFGMGALGVAAFNRGHSLGVTAACLVAPAAGGFLCRNFPPARIFLGDVGSVPLGFLCGACAIIGTHDGAFDAWVPLLAFSPFIVDATVTLAKRAWRRVRVWQAHREHYYQRLVLAGWGHRKTVVAEYGLMALAAGSAVGYGRAPDPVKLALLVAWFVAYVFLGVSVDRYLRRIASGRAPRTG